MAKAWGRPQLLLSLLPLAVMLKALASPDLGTGVCVVMAYPLLGRRAGELPGGMGSACGGGWRRQEENGTPHACRGSPCCLGSTREGRLGAVGDGVDNEPWMEVPNPNEDLLPPPLHLPLPPSSSRTGPHALWVVVPSRDIQNRIWYAVPPSFFITSLLQSISGGHVCEKF